MTWGEFPFTPLMNSTQAASCRPTVTKVVTGRRGLDGSYLVYIIGCLAKYWIETLQIQFPIDGTCSTGRWWTNDPSLGPSMDTAQAVY